MTIKNPKKTKLASYGLSIGKQSEEKDKILLLGLSEKLARLAHFSWYDFHPQLDMRNAIPLGSITYYCVVLFDDHPNATKRNILQKEFGWGRVVKSDSSKDIFLERLEATEYDLLEDGGGDSSSTMRFDDSQHLVVMTASVPYKHLFSLENTVICSLGQGVPELVHLQDGDVLVNINNDVKGASISEVVSSTSNYLDLNGKDSTISSNTLRLKSQKSRPKDVEPGTIIYNNRKKCFEGYDGKKWKALKWED